MEQTGLINQAPRPTDYVAGALDYEILLEDGDWTKYEPTGERQNNPFVFDTKACVTFSFLNVLEAQFKMFIENGLLPKDAGDFLRKNGYMDAGEVNFSDKFLAIMSSTTEDGNTPQNVMDTARNIGLIPQSMLPFGNEQTWQAWHNPNQITTAMKELAAESRKYFKAFYEFAFFGEDKDFERDEYEACEKALKQSPLLGAIPFPASHAIMVSNVKPKKDYRIFNSYEPYGQVKKWDKPIHYAFKVIVKPTMNKYIYFKDSEVVGLKPELVLMLDKARGYAGIPFVINSGYRSQEMNEGVGGVADSAHMTGLAVDLRCRSSRERFKILSGLLIAGFNRIGIGATFIHADCDTTKDAEVVWLY